MGGRFGAKHQRKVNECYPQGTGEVGAAGGKISALTYYINAKPAKLLKVAAYLEYKVPRDLTRESPQYNGVTLEIVLGIMHGCSDYFVTFAPTVLKIITFYAGAMLTTELVIGVHGLFAEFCKMTKSILPSIRDLAFFELLTQVLERILRNLTAGQFCLEEIGKDILAAVAMEDFRAPLGDVRIKIIASTIVHELQSHEFSHLKVEELLQQHRYGGGERGDIPHMMGSALVTLIEGSSSTTVPMIMDSVFGEFSKDGWTHPRMWGAVQSILINGVPAQYLCVVLSELFRRLETEDVNFITVLTDMIAEILRSNRSPLGYSALELTSNLLKLLRRQKGSLFISNNLEMRASFAKFEVPPPKTVFSICNAFVSLLRNANFGLQKYEIIEHIIGRAFFPGSLISGSNNSFRVGTPVASVLDLERHSIGAVTLDSIEEGHFRSIVWSILFALAEEVTPPSVLRLAFVEVHIKLFELLFCMLRVPDSEFCLNSLVFLQQLLINGLAIVPNRRTTVDSPVSIVSTITLGRSSNYVLTKIRVALGILVTEVAEDFITIVHIAAIFALLQAIIPQCDLVHLAYFLRFNLWLHKTCLGINRLTFEDRACVSLFTNYILQDIGKFLANGYLTELANEALLKLQNVGMSMISMEDIIDLPHPGPILSGTENFEPEKMIPEISILMSAFERASEGFGAIETVKERNILALPFDCIEADKRMIVTLQPNSDRPPTISLTKHQSSGRSNAGTFSRLSKLGGGSTARSSVTAPAFYRVGSSMGGQMTRALTVSSSSLTQSDIRSLNLPVPTDLLEGQFDELSLRVREGKKKEHSKSMLFFRRE